MRGGLQQQGGFADARIATHQDGRCWHQPAAQNPVKFIHPAGGAGQGRFLGGQIAQLDGAAACRPKGLLACGCGKWCVLGDGIPSAAGLATAGPFAVDCATFRTGKGRCRARHAASCPGGSSGSIVLLPWHHSAAAFFIPMTLACPSLAGRACTGIGAISLSSSYSVITSAKVGNALSALVRDDCSC